MSRWTSSNTDRREDRGQICRERNETQASLWTLQSGRPPRVQVCLAHCSWVRWRLTGLDSTDIVVCAEHTFSSWGSGVSEAFSDLGH